ncbi:NagC family transcriptional regulator [Bifidobacterium rousetti]|uniref:ROK family protein n=1 Tax=Bifidobacterium rousetti TaxID=2045439 RepID=UPI00123C2BF5|nr:ROK family protein [Bifidobacterium rousetti]KAA8815299.1 NagC family transcriptional regulator [Bifidobacterium rousetti]
MDEDDWSGGGQATFPHWFEGSEYMHRVACAIAKYGPIARTTLAQLLGLSQGALSRITSDLIYAGVIEELPGDAVARGPLPQGFTPRESSGRRGRPQTALALRANARTFVGIKAHGTSAIAAAVNAHGEVVSGRHEMAFPDRSPEQVTSVLAALVRECEADIAARDGVAPLPAPTAVGIAIGGHVADDDRTVTFAPFLRWDHDVPLAAMVGDATGLPCGVYNDIDSLLVDASWFGPGVGLEAFAVLTIGIGIGYSLAVHGRPVSYPDKSYGLLGHVLVDPEGPRCTAGHIGCAQCLTDDSLADQYSQMMGRACTFDDFARDARAGVPQASRLLDKTCFRLGSLIATVANIAMPSKVMIAGESAFLAKMAIDPIRDGINRYRHSQASPVEFTVMDHDWQLWAKAAASRVIVRYLE